MRESQVSFEADRHSSSTQDPDVRASALPAGGQQAAGTVPKVVFRRCRDCEEEGGGEGAEGGEEVGRGRACTSPSGGVLAPHLMNRSNPVRRQ